MPLRRPSHPPNAYSLFNTEIANVETGAHSVAVASTPPPSTGLLSPARGPLQLSWQPGRRPLLLPGAGRGGGAIALAEEAASLAGLRPRQQQQHHRQRHCGRPAWACQAQWASIARRRRRIAGWPEAIGLSLLLLLLLSARSEFLRIVLQGTGLSRPGSGPGPTPSAGRAPLGLPQPAAPSPRPAGTIRRIVPRFVVLSTNLAQFQGSLPLAGMTT